MYTIQNTIINTVYCSREGNNCCNKKRKKVQVSFTSTRTVNSTTVVSLTDHLLTYNLQTHCKRRCRRRRRRRRCEEKKKKG